MISTITAGLIVLLGIIGGLISTLVVIMLIRSILLKNSNRIDEALVKVINDDRSRFYDELDKARANLEARIEIRRVQIESELLRQEAVIRGRLKAAEKQAIDDDGQRVLALNEGLSTSIGVAKDQFKQLAAHFRETMGEDVTTELVAAAYSVVEGHHKPRDIRDSELAKAVIEHRNSGAPGSSKVTKAKLPSSGGMN